MATGILAFDDVSVTTMGFGGFMLVAYHTFVPGETSFRAGGAALLRMAFDVFCVSGLPPGVMLHDIHAARVSISRS